MTTNRRQTQHGARQRVQERDTQTQLERRRESMQAAEGHAGSIPRGNQQAEHEILGYRREEYERLLGH